jgi:hypothetical protein
MTQALDAAVLFDRIDLGTDRISDDEQNSLIHLMEARRQFVQDDMQDGWIFNVTLCRSKITGELGLRIITALDDKPALSVHDMPEYAEITHRQIPFVVSARYNYDDVVERYEYYVGCFIRADQLEHIAMCGQMLTKVSKKLRACRGDKHHHSH